MWINFNFCVACSIFSSVVIEVFLGTLISVSTWSIGQTIKVFLLCVLIFCDTQMGFVTVQINIFITGIWNILWYRILEVEDSGHVGCYAVSTSKWWCFEGVRCLNLEDQAVQGGLILCICCSDWAVAGLPGNDGSILGSDDIFLFFKVSRLTLGPNQLHIQWLPGTLSQRYNI